VHVFGGRDSARNIVSSYEVLNVNVSTYEHQIDPWVVFPYTAAVQGTASSAAVVLKPIDFSLAGLTRNWIYLMGGEFGTGASYIQLIYAGLIQADGSLTISLSTSSDLKGAISGHCITQSAGSYLLMGSGTSTANQFAGSDARGREARQSGLPPAIGGNNDFNPSPDAATNAPYRFGACGSNAGLLYFIGGNTATGAATGNVEILVQ